MASNYTSNYGLCQWEATDQVLRTEFNEDNAKVDVVLAELATQTATLATKGNCSIETFTYTGNGIYGEGNPTIIPFSRIPVMFAVLSTYTLAVGSGYDLFLPTVLYTSSGASTGLVGLPITWNGTQLSVTSLGNAKYQLNEADLVYRVIAFYAEDI